MYMYRYIVKIHCAGKRPGPAVLTGDLFYIIYLEITSLEIVIINMQIIGGMGGVEGADLMTFKQVGKSTYTYVQAVHALPSPYGVKCQAAHQHQPSSAISQPI
jgi:hypothetical protein